MSASFEIPSTNGQRLVEFERLLDAEEAAALLKIHPKTLRRMARHGRIAGTQIGRLWRFRASELDRWFQSAREVRK